MSDSSNSQNRADGATTRQRSDGGFTLSELLLAVMLMSLLAGVLSSSVILALRSANSTEGRANVARSESSVGTWLPADLASTDVNKLDVGGLGIPSVNLDPAVEPCSSTCGSIDLSGANALQLAWETDGVVTVVQYQYIQIGDEWRLRRISCEGSNTCQVQTILFDVEPPPDPATFDPATDRPVWVMDVAVPADPAGLDLSENARQIVVTVDGGGENIGAGGGLNSISLTAGGRSTDEIDPDDFTVPSFVRAKSRCGGPVTLIVDDSGSIGGAVSTVVEPGVKAFVEAFRGTPTQLQIIQFSSDSQAIGPSGASANGGWHRYIDMTDDSAVDQLKSAVDALDSSGGTNWEDAFFHTFKESDGTTADLVPNRLVFFTDGIPTRNRSSRLGAWQSQYSNGAKYIHYNAGLYNSNWPQETGGDFHQESWDRADVILDDHRNVDMIFVGVGPDLNDWVSWRHDPSVYQDTSVNPPAAQNKRAWETIAYLLANAPSGQVPAIYDSGANEYTNPETADFYLQNSFDADAFAAAMKAAALKDCGGTLTVQTRLTDGTPLADEVIYENRDFRDDTGTSLNPETRRVTTSSVFQTGTFDFEISDTSAYFDVDVVPAELQTLSSYTFQGWSCRAGATDKTPDMTSIPITDSSFSGFSVPVFSNEAVSCIMTVSP